MLRNSSILLTSERHFDIMHTLTQGRAKVTCKLCSENPWLVKRGESCSVKYRPERHTEV